MEHERWLPIPDLPGYRVSDLGRVYSEPRWSGGNTQGRRYREGRVLTPIFDSRGYPKYSLYVNGRGRQIHAHTLVLTAFVGPRPPGKECCHGPAGPSDPSLTNLRWDTHGNNLRDKTRDGTDYHASRSCCPRKHEYSEANTYRHPGGRQCRACNKAHNRLCRGRICDHTAPEFIAAADWYYQNPGKRWTSRLGATTDGR